MISVVIPTRDSAAGLSVTLACLVGAAIDGLVKEVLVADGGSSDDTLEIAEDAGAQILKSGAGLGERLAAACGAARADWLLVLAPGARLQAGWERSVADHLTDATDRAAIFAAARGGGLAERVGRALGGLTGAPGLDRGLLTPRAVYQAVGGYRDIEAADRDLTRRIGRSRLRTLAAGLTAPR